MAVNILDLFKNQVSGSLAQAAAGFLGESESSTKSVLETVAPALLGSLIQKGSTESGAASILNLLNQDDYDNNILGSLGGLMSGGNDKLSSIANIGMPIVRTLLGDKVGGIIDWISNKNSVKSSSVSTLMSMAAPFLLGLIGRQVKTENLGATGLSNLLSSQSSWVKSLLPAGLSGLLNFSGFSGSGSTPSTTTTNYNSTNDNNEGGGMGKWLPWLLLLGLLGLLWWFMRGCNKEEIAQRTEDTMEQVDQMADKTGDAISGAAEDVSDAAKNAANEIKGKLDEAGNWIYDLGNDFELKLPKTTLKVHENSVERRLVDFINTGETDIEKLKNTWFSFDRLYFETGKSTLTADSKQQVENIATILKAYPNVNIKLGGYTDSDGNEADNKKLSQDRADAAKKAIALLGVAGNRIETEGYGEEHPICPANDTRECKAQNRRIDIRVTKM